MNKIEFLIQGSSDSEYQVIFYKTSNSVAATCTCLAGENGTYCKHRLDILKGEITNVKSKNTNQVSMVLEWYANSPLQQQVNLLEELEDEKQQLTKRIFKEKKSLAKMLSKAA